MADLSTLPAITTIAGTEKVATSQGGVAKTFTLSLLATWLTSSMSSGFGKVMTSLGSNVDNAAAINAQLNNAANPGVFLMPGTYGISSAIIVPSGKFLIGAGRGQTFISMLAGFSGGTNNSWNCSIGSTIGATDIIISDLTCENNKVGNDTVPNHKSGIKIMQANRFLVERVKVRNVSGYGLHAQGLYSATPTYCKNGMWRDVITENCNVHIEQTCSEYITVDGFYCSDGDNDCLVEAYLHPLEASRYITYMNGEVNGVLGAAGVGLSAAKGAANVSTHGVNYIRLENVRVTCKGIAIVVGGTSTVPFKNYTFEDCEFTSTNNVGVNIGYVTDFKSRNSKFTGSVTAFQFASCSALLRDSTFTASATGAASAYGISNSSGSTDSRISIRGESSISLTVATGAKFHVAGEGVYLERDTIIVGETVNGVRSITATNNYYAALEDMEKTISLSWAGQNQSVQIYPHASAPWPIGTRIWVRETTGLSGGAVKTIGAQAGVTINSPGNLTSLKAYGSVMLEKVATNTWRMSGDLQ